ncbi:MAG: Asp-tRNA(Asn)/Glu-tRNA(Gln) amidotransferase subunit GatA [Candidatus Omnitrophica bacterium]|nr:Asp-tRNA(Asn)/Glu-tRNA(Gln) amidotransferase subunit GatA [Candidatus Omnitrophota bacterium]
MEQLYRHTAHSLRRLIDQGRTTPAEIIDALGRRITDNDPVLNAYVRRDACGEPAFAPQSTQGILAGIPVAVKDNICTAGALTQCCSKILEGFDPPYDATVIRKLKEAGAAVMRLKTNMDEFAFGSSTENSFFGPTRNPWDHSRVPGGSSGGSAAAVAGDEAVMALGSDTGGSIRQPASFCGVVGMKPTYGRVSRYGLIAFASSLDQIGPLTKDTRDCALLLQAIAGHDPLDSTSVDVAVPDYSAALDKDVKGMKIGIPGEYFVEGMDAEVRDIIASGIEQLRALGAVVREVSLPHTAYAVPVYYVIATAEASSNLARFDGVQYGFRAEAAGLIEQYFKTRGEGFGQEAKRRIILGTFALSHGYYDAYYLSALKVRALIKRDFDAVFKDCDLIVTPTAPTPAFKIGEKTEDPLKMYLSDIYTISANLAGIPAVSIPCGRTRAGLPVGMQMLAGPFGEETILRAAHAYEQATDWHRMRP